MQNEERMCPKCWATTNQMSMGFNRSGSKRCKCGKCGKTYTPNPKPHAYSDEVRAQALETYFSGVSGRGVGKLLKMHHANAVVWAKKNRDSVGK
jgi:transposase-like protein